MRRKMGKLVDLTGQKFGKLTVNCKDEKDHVGASHTYWICTCECTRNTVVRASHLITGNIKSCGVCCKEDLTGQRFGKLMVIKLIPEKHTKRCNWWMCICNCIDKKIVLATTSSLKYGTTTSCGCINKPNLIGQKFGRLVVVSESYSYDQERFWNCLCEDGNEVIVSTGRLKSGNVKSCGCLKKFEYGKSSINKLYQNYIYGANARGIEFALSFDLFSFLTNKDCFYCGSLPSKIITGKGLNGEYTYNGIDRADNDKGYLEDNVVTSCRKCNWMKYTLDSKEFINHLYDIRLYYKEDRNLISSCDNILEKYASYMSGIVCFLANYKCSAKRRNLDFDISKEIFIWMTSQPCFYCGGLPNAVTKSHNKKLLDYVHNGIDRLDNNIGYNIDNIVPCCTICNKMKHELSLSDFLSHVNKIAEFQNSKQVKQEVNHAIV